MHYRSLGSTGLNVSVLSYGASPLGNAFRTIDDNEGIRTVRTALVRDRGLPGMAEQPAAFEIRQHRRYNPAAVTSLNIVPGLLGTILTMTMLIFTALSVTRELERGTMESLLAMPIEPIEIMLGKIAPYVVIGFIQAALIIALGIALFEVPVAGSMLLLAALSTLFIATNLSIGYTFSTIAQTRPVLAGETATPILPLRPFGKPGLSVRSVQVVPPSVERKRPLPGPPLITFQGSRPCSHIAA